MPVPLTFSLWYVGDNRPEKDGQGPGWIYSPSRLAVVDLTSIVGWEIRIAVKSGLAAAAVPAFVGRLLVCRMTGLIWCCPPRIVVKAG